MEKLERIKNTALMVSDNKLDQLRIEEELLIMLIKSAKEKNLTLKTKACERLACINSTQLEMLGAKIDVVKASRLAKEISK